jgi:hypothetical protein
MPFGRRVSTIEDTDDLLTERQVIEFVATTDKVLAEDEARDGLYFNGSDVIAQLAPDEDNGRFEATWDGDWKFGRWVQDA